MNRRLGPLPLAALVGVAACGALLGFPACGRGDGSSGRERLTVLAAASLTEAFSELGRRFEADHPDVDVELSFGGSSALARHVLEGAPADVFAAADEEAMALLTDAGRVGRARIFARNRLVIAVAPGNPEGVRAVEDLARPGLVVVLCSPTAPCGRLADRVLAAAGVRASTASLEDDVKGVVAKVALGEADAGLVYATDVRAARPPLDAVLLPDALSVATGYPVAVVRGAVPPAAAAEFVRLLLSSAGRRLLAAHSFLGP